MPRAAAPSTTSTTSTTRTKRRSAWASALAAGCALATGLAAPVPAHAAGAGPGTSYVALGDSYAAGSAIPTLSGGLCLRSSRSYARLVAASLAPASYMDVTCAGAKVNALTTAQTDAGIRVNGPQLDAVTPDTGLVTLTIGGNNLGTSDVGFVDVVATCTALAPTSPLGAPCRDFYGDTLAKRLDAVAPRLADGLQRVHATAPGARVLVVGYPAVLPDDVRQCVGKLPATVGDLAYLRSVLAKLNDVVATTARANGAAYVDTFGPTKGHDSCSPSPWVEGLVPAAPTLPFHPNATGERARADAVLGALRG